MEQQLKERLVGAVVLMVAAMVSIPMILSGPHDAKSVTASRPAPAPASTPALQDFSSRIVPIAPAPEQPTRPVPAPEPVSAPVRDAGAPRDPAPAPSSETVHAAPAPAADPAPARAPASTQARAPAPALAPAPAPAPAPGPRAADPPARAPQAVATRSGWVVQLGSFSNARNAHALRDRLTAIGFAAFAESSGSGTEAVTRVYVGPEPERERAERHVATLFEQTRLKGIVVRYPGE